MLPVWADVLIVVSIPVILLGVQYLLDRRWGKDEPGNMIVHDQQDEPREDEPELFELKPVAAA